LQREKDKEIKTLNEKKIDRSGKQSQDNTELKSPTNLNKMTSKNIEDNFPEERRIEFGNVNLFWEKWIDKNL
jgi:hypothetical protein